VASAWVPWDEGLHTRVLDVNVAASRGALGALLRRLAPPAVRVTHVAWGAPPGAPSGDTATVLEALANGPGLVGFAAGCGSEGTTLPLREGSFDVVAALALESLCRDRGLDWVLLELDRLCRGGGILLLELSSDAAAALRPPPGWHVDVAFFLLREGRAARIFVKGALAAVDSTLG